jgi:hypothetical protein
MADALKWVKAREGYLKSLSNVYVADWKTFEHVMTNIGRVSAEDMKARAPDKQNPMLGAAAAMSLKNADSHEALAKIYNGVKSSGEAVCTTFAAAAAYILADPSGPKVEVIAHRAASGHRGTHLFVAVGRGDSEITDPSWIKPSCVIVDCWVQALGSKQLWFPADKFTVSPIKTETNRLEVVKDVSSITTQSPVLDGGSATGGGKGKCYITTATCNALGLGDDCNVLETLRGYRDDVILKTPEGTSAVAQYYALAPALVEEIDAQPDRDALYAEIYRDYIAPAAAAIAEDDPARARAIFDGFVTAVASGMGIRKILAARPGRH